MQGKLWTNIFYHVPEDRDSPQQPNCFAVPVPRGALKLEHVYHYFPLRGTYIFRFKLAFEGAVVWLDLADPAATLPAFKDAIVLKASRLSWHDSKPHLAKTQKHSPTIAEAKPVRKQPSGLIDHQDISHKYESAQSAKSSHEDTLGVGMSSSWQGGAQSQPTLLEGFHGGPSQLSYFEVKQAQPPKYTQQSVNLMGSFERHGDLI